MSQPFAPAPPIREYAPKILIGIEVLVTRLYVLLCSREMDELRMNLANSLIYGLILA